MANLFSEMAHKAIGDLTLKISPDEKRALNIAAGAITSYLGSGDYLSGAVGVSVTEAMQNILKDVKDPTVKEILVGIASATAGRMASLQVESVVASAINAEIFNHLTHEQQEKLQKALEEAGNDPEKITAILEYFIGLSLGNIQFNPEGGEYMEPGTINALNGILKLGDCGARFEVNENLGLHENLKAARAALDLYHVLKYAPDLFEDAVITTTTGFAGKAIKGAEGLIVTYGPQTYEILMDIRDGNWDNVLVDLEKDAFFYGIDKVIGKKVTKYILVPVESGFQVYINNKYKE